jgi:hypothetical protein
MNARAAVPHFFALYVDEAHMSFLVPVKTKVFSEKSPI